MDYKTLIADLMKECSVLDDKKYLMMLIAHNGGTTIEKLKPSSLIILKDKSDRKLFTAWEYHRDEIVEYFNLDFHELKRTKNSVHILFYNKEMLIEILNDEKNMSFLSRFGYSNEISLEENLKILKENYETVCPHEIGIFLGYPVSDVIDFIKCPNKKCLMVGYWKVYNDIDRAKTIFEMYDNAKKKVLNSTLQYILE